MITMNKLEDITMGNQQVFDDNLYQLPELNVYYCNNNGDIFSFRNNKLKKLSPYKHYGRSKNPYLRIKVAGKLYLAHRLIASVIKNGILTQDEQVNHKNGNTLDNRIINLEVVTARQNVDHAIKNNLYCSGEQWYIARGLL